MPPLPPRTPVLLFGSVVAVLLLGALAARGAASTLVTPMPAVGMMPAMLAWFLFAAAMVFVLGKVELPRLVRRLLVIATLAISGWSIGTIARGVYVTLAFAVGGPVEEEESSWQVLGTPATSDAAQSLVASSLELKRTVSVPFDSAAIAEIRPHLTCFTLPVERTGSGVARVRLPDTALGVDDLDPCPAVRRLGD